MEIEGWVRNFSSHKLRGGHENFKDVLGGYLRISSAKLGVGHVYFVEKSWVGHTKLAF